MDRHFVAGEIVIDEEAAPLVDRELLHQRAPTPIVIAPITWLRADFGLRMRPAAQTASMRRTRISPVAASTPTSTKCAPKVDC